LGVAVHGANNECNKFGQNGVDWVLGKITGGEMPSQFTQAIS